MTDDAKLQIDKINEMTHEIEDCRQNLMDYRAHLALKFEEHQGNIGLRNDLKDNEAEVICDWKMKLLSCYYQENQQLFFGKRGTSCIGFTNSNTPGKKKFNSISCLVGIRD